jgi:selenium-binding protein 1
MEEPLPPGATYSHTFKRGLTYNVDGKDYYLHGVMENGVRDVPGHTWKKGNYGWIEGRHYNSGPFGMPKWWSSDADDGELLYEIWAKVDTWSEEKVAQYKSWGFTHYHELVGVSDKAPHPSKVMYLKHTAVTSFTLDGGNKPWMAHSVSPGIDYEFMPNIDVPYPPREELLYTLCVDQGGQDPDFIAVIGADPDEEEEYGQIIHRVDMPQMGDELHHFGSNIFQTRLLVPGLFSGRMHIIDIETDPKAPTLESWHGNLTADSGYIIPHTVVGTPDGGYMVSMIGSNTADTAPGGVVKLDSNANFVAPFGPPSNRDPSVTPPTYMYDIGINLLRNRMITTAFGLPAGVGGGINPAGLGNEVYVWDYKAQQVTQVVDIGASTGALEVRWLNEAGSPIGFTNAPGTSEIWRWDDTDLDGTYDFAAAITLPAGSTPTDMLLSKDDKFMYIANWTGDNVMQYDISDPFNPVFVSQVPVPHAQMMRLSPDNTRLYVTNSLLSTWDDTEYPAGVFRNTDYAMYLINIDHENGGMTIDQDFTIDFDNVQKKNTVGACRPHQTFFDANIKHGFGEH